MPDYRIRKAAPVLAALALVLAIGGAARAAETNSAPAVGFQSFSVISQRNIFDPTRRAGRRIFDPGSTPRTRPSESFTLRGTVTSEQGTFAMFVSDSAQFNKTVKPGDTIANYKVAEIEHEYVKLAASSNQTIKLPMLAQMRREVGGPWSIGGPGELSAEPAPGAAGSKPTPASASSGVISDVMKRLMQKREEEK